MFQKLSMFFAFCQRTWAAKKSIIISIGLLFLFSMFLVGAWDVLYKSRFIIFTFIITIGSFLLCMSIKRWKFSWLIDLKDYAFCFAMMAFIISPYLGSIIDAQKEEMWDITKQKNSAQDAVRESNMAQLAKESDINNSFAQYDLEQRTETAQTVSPTVVQVVQQPVQKIVATIATSTATTSVASTSPVTKEQIQALIDRLAELEKEKSAEKTVETIPLAVVQQFTASTTIVASATTQKEETASSTGVK